MKTDFGTIDGVATVADALKKMKTLKTAVLIVNKRNEDDEYGMLTSGDIARHVLAKDRAPDRVNVYEIMSKPVISVHPDMDIRYCSRLFANYNLVRRPFLKTTRLSAWLALIHWCSMACTKRFNKWHPVKNSSTIYPSRVKMLNEWKSRLSML